MGIPPSTICLADGEGGLLLPLFPNEVEVAWPVPLRMFLYFLGLLYSFVGVSVIAEIFMEAIEEITSTEREVEVWDPVLHQKVSIREKVWNGTVANLTLLALGSSAPEILLNVVEVAGHGFFAGDLGPSTIIGSASFNFLIIISVCIVAIPDTEERRIRSFPVFVVTGMWSVFAYFWMWFVISVHTPDVITISEAVLTFTFLPVLVYMGYRADIGVYDSWCGTVDPNAHGAQHQELLRTGSMRRSTVTSANSSGNRSHELVKERELLEEHMRRVRASYDPRGKMTQQQVADMAAVELGISKPRSMAFYRSVTFRSTRRPSGAGPKGNRLLLDRDARKKIAKATRTAYHSVRFLFPRIDEAIKDPESVEQRRRQSIAEAEAAHHAAKMKKREERAALGDNGSQPRRLLHRLSDVFQGKGRSSSGRKRAHPTLLSPAQERSDRIHRERTRDFAVVQVDMDGEERPGPISTAWWAQITDAVRVDWSDDGDDPGSSTGGDVPHGFVATSSSSSSKDGEGMGAWDWILHVLVVPWKLIFAITCPPAWWGGGLPTFFLSLACIGFLTALVADMAGILGCVAGIPDPVTAITLVALGTSLPDTFASKIAAENEPTADASITNVTGSNSVNVFLGLGLPWLCASLYWSIVGPTDEWLSRYPDVASQLDPSRAVYVVLGGDLGFSVANFFLASLLGTILLLWRRFVLGAELGGDRTRKWGSAAFLITLWIIYTVAAILKFTGAI